MSRAGHPRERRASAAASPGGFHPDPPSLSPLCLWSPPAASPDPRVALPGAESRGCWLGVSRGSLDRGASVRGWGWGKVIWAADCEGAGEGCPTPGREHCSLVGTCPCPPHPNLILPHILLHRTSPPPPQLLFNSSCSPRPLFLCFRCLLSQLLARWGVYPVPPPPSPPPRSGGFRLALAHHWWPSEPGTFSVGNAPAVPAGSREHGCRAGPLPWARLCPAYTGLWSPNRDQRTTIPLRANVSAIAGVYPGRRTCHNTPPHPQATPSEVLGDGGCVGKLTRWLWGT